MNVNFPRTSSSSRAGEGQPGDADGPENSVDKRVEDLSGSSGWARVAVPPNLHKEAAEAAARCETP